ncbi:MAG TPA: hypothetical protein PK649_11820 [Vicingus sp.]|nr:hypothetical protein [Vicingus sp.]HRP59900.1 hypothetical protein [Vicingus sp.]
MRFIVFIILFLQLIQPQLAKSQVVDEIKAYVDSTEFIVNNGRKLLIEKINNKDYQKAKEIYQYLNQETQSKNYKAFSYNEHLFFNAIIKDWEKMLQLFKEYDVEKNHYNFPYSYPIGEVLFNNFTEQIDSIENNINKVEIANEDKDILILYLSLFEKDRNIEEYNKMLSAFHKNYNPTRYESFVKNYLPRKFTRVFFDISFGTNITFPTGKIKEEFTPNPPGFSVSIDFTLGKFYSSLYAMISDLESKNSFNAIVNSDTLFFKKNDGFQFSNVGLKTGYHLTKNTKIQLVPYVSISSNTLESTLYDSNKDGDEHKIISSFGYGFGSFAEFRILKFKNTGYYSSIGTSYLGLRVDGGYTVIANHKKGYSGNIPYVNFTLTWGFGALDF